MGVQIETLKPGDGVTFPQSGQKVGRGKYHLVRSGQVRSGQSYYQVSCHYVLTLESGKKVDSSRDRGRPFMFTLGKKEVIEGWEQGIAQMSKGQRAKLTISSDLGYGPRGTGPIPGNATLIFDVELLMIQ